MPRGDLRGDLNGSTQPATGFRQYKKQAAWGVAAAVAAIAVYWIVKPSPQADFGGGGRFGAGLPMAVETAKVEQGDVHVILNALGTVTPLASVTVKTQINGLLQQIAFQEGQTVHQGDFLAQIDPRPYEATLTQAQGMLTRDQAQLAGARVDLERYKTLVEQDSIAKQTLDTEVALVAQLEGTVATDQGQVQSAKVNLAYTHIVSPITGRVGLRQVDQGNYVQISDPNGIVLINQVQPITVIFPLPEDNIPEVIKQMNAGTLEVTAYDRNNKVKLASGKLMTVDNTIDPTTGTVKLRAQFDNETNTLFPDQFVNIQLLVNTLHNQTVVPKSAVETGAPGRFVYLVNTDSTVKVQPIKLGVLEGTRQAVDSGLNPGDTVVVEGVDQLRDGARVILPGQQIPDGPPGGKRREGQKGEGQRGDGANRGQGRRNDG